MLNKQEQISPYCKIEDAALSHIYLLNHVFNLTRQINDLENFNAFNNVIITLDLTFLLIYELKLL